MKIYSKTAITLLFASLIPMTIFSLFGYFMAKKTITEHELVHLEAMANIQKKRVEETIARSKERLDLITSRVPMRVAMLEFMQSGDRRQLEIVISSISGAKEALNDLKKVYILSPEGKVMASTDRAMYGADHSGTEYFIRGMEGFSLDVFSSDASSEVTNYLSAPIYHEGKKIGVMVAEVSLDWIASITNDYAGLENTGESLLVKRDKDGDALYIVPLRFDPQAALKRKISRHDLNVSSTLAMLKQERSSVDNIDYRGKPVLAVTSYIKEMDWGMVVKKDKEEAYAPLVKLGYLSILFTFFTLLLVLVLTFYKARSLTAPLVALTHAARRISEGDLSARAAVTSKDEIGDLERYFNKMTDGLISANHILRESEEQVKIFIEYAPAALAMFDREMRYTAVSRRWMNDFFLGDRNIIGLSHYEIFPEISDRWKAVHRRAMSGEVVTADEDRFEREGGAVQWLRWEARPWHAAGGGIGGIVIFSEDITERKKAEEALKGSEKRYRSLVGAVTDCIYTVKVDNGCPVSTSYGAGAVALTGYSSDDYEADQNLWHRMVYEDDRQRVIERSANIISGNDAQPFEYRIIHRDGSIRWVRDTPVHRYDEQGRLISYDGLISDITERKKLEDQLRHSQKMEAIGTLTGGIAHDFNNVLTAMMSYCSLLQMKMKKNETQAHYVDQILSLVERATIMTKSLLSFSRKQISAMKPADLNGIIKRVEKLLKRLISEDIEMKAILADMDLSVMADGGQIEQVLMNLCTNARDAMPKGGKLTIETGMVKLDREYTASHGYGEAGSYALISVRDTGIGMDEKTKVKIFEPFFTTKEIGKGTGLGLSMTYGIIKQHQGYINVESRPGEGTEFRVYLPLITEKVETTYPQTEASIPDLSEGGKDTILLAEDEKYLREATKEVLEGFGYRVIAAVDGKDAIDKFIEKKNDIHLLILDAVMPVKNGNEAYKEIKKIRPDIRSIFLSGHTMDAINKKETLDEGVSFIAKPVSPKDLLARIKEVFDNE